MRIFFLSVFLIAICASCSSPESPEFLHAIEHIQSGYLGVSTYDSANQVVHPDVLWDEEEKQFWMAITPYPDYQNEFENPCLYYSKDGMVFISEGINNPLASRPAKGFNCDPDLFIDKDGLKKLIYVETVAPSHQIIHLFKIRKDLKIEKDTLWIHSLDSVHNKADFVLSPSIVVENEDYSMYYVNLKKSANEPNEVKFGKISKLADVHASHFKRLNLPLPKDYNPWHIDVFKTTKRYIMLLNGFYGGKYDNNGGSLTSEYSIQLLSSKDGRQWENHGDIIGKGNPEAETVCTDPFFHYVYRASGLYSEKRKELVVWYSYVSTDNVWKLATHKFSINFDK